VPVRSPLQGRPPALPGPLDRLADRWARQPPRARWAALALVAALVVWAQGAHLAAVQARWGGPGVRVWVADRTVPAGADPRPALDPVRLPAGVVPPSAVTGGVPADALLSLPLVAGGVLTDVHLAPAGPAAGLADGERLVPVPVDAGWGVVAGARVDVWVGGTDAAPRLLAEGRPVLQVAEDRVRPVALVAVDAGDVAAVTHALSRGEVLLALTGRR
jgi:hypothetical protein